MDNNTNIIRSISQLRASGDTYEFVVSDESVDRHGTVIKVAAWDIENYNRNGIVAYMHDANNRDDIDKIIGKGTVRVEGGQLIGVVDFEPEELNPLAAKVKGKIDFGSLSATSVGFIPKSGHYGNAERNEDPEVYYFDDVELIEFSIVNVPSNANALKRNMQLDTYLEGEKRDATEEAEEESDGIDAADYMRLRKQGYKPYEK